MVLIGKAVLLSVSRRGRRREGRVKDEEDER
jgi:hypothetical protein